MAIKKALTFKNYDHTAPIQQSVYLSTKIFKGFHLVVSKHQQPLEMSQMQDLHSEQLDPLFRNFWGNVHIKKEIKSWKKKWPGSLLGIILFDIFSFLEEVCNYPCFKMLLFLISTGASR